MLVLYCTLCALHTVITRLSLTLSVGLHEQGATVSTAICVEKNIIPWCDSEVLAIQYNNLKVRL